MLNLHINMIETGSKESIVRERYAAGAKEPVDEICCPVDYKSEYLKVLPREVIERDYGCGDPSRYLHETETVLVPVERAPDIIGLYIKGTAVFDPPLIAYGPLSSIDIPFQQDTGSTDFSKWADALAASPQLLNTVGTTNDTLFFGTGKAEVVWSAKVTLDTIVSDPALALNL